MLYLLPNLLYPISYHTTSCLLIISSFVSSLSFLTIPQDWEKLFVDQNWKMKEMNALKKKDTWEIVLLPDGKRAVGCSVFNKV